MEQNSPLISVIVPVFKVEEYLSSCVKSIQEQSFSDIEIILVDDGSPDQSGQMCDDLARQDSRIRVIHQQNMGQAAARNNGVKLSRGKYISFVDSDDQIEPSLLETLLRMLLQYDSQVAICDYQSFSGTSPDMSSHIRTPKAKILRLSGFEAAKELLYQKTFETCPWGKLYERALIVQHPYPEGRLYEDLFATYKILLSAQIVTYCPEKLYCYRKNPESTMNRGYHEKVFDEIEAVQSIVDFVTKHDPELLSAANARKYSSYSQVLSWMPIQSDDEQIKSQKSRIWAYLSSYRWKMFLDNNARAKNRIAALLTLLGCDLFQRIEQYFIR